MKTINLLDRNFPEDLAERCKAMTGEKTAAKAVQRTLVILFRNNDELNRLRRKHSTTEQKLNRLVDALKAQQQAKRTLEQAFKEAQDPDLFTLEQEKR